MVFRTDATNLPDKKLVVMALRCYDTESEFISDLSRRVKRTLPDDYVKKLHRGVPTRYRKFLVDIVIGAPYETVAPVAADDTTDDTTDELDPDDLDGILADGDDRLIQETSDEKDFDRRVYESKEPADPNSITEYDTDKFAFKTKDLDDMFAEVWKIYPHPKDRGSRGLSRRHWENLLRKGFSPEKLFAAVGQYGADRTKGDPYNYKCSNFFGRAAYYANYLNEENTNDTMLSKRLAKLKELQSNDNG